MTLYDPARFDAKGELYFRLVAGAGVAGAGAGRRLGYAFPTLLPGNNASLIGLVILTFGLFGWRTAYGWLVQQPYMREKVYVLGTGERAQRLVQGIAAAPGIGRGRGGLERERGRAADPGNGGCALDGTGRQRTACTA